MNRQGAFDEYDATQIIKKISDIVNVLHDNKDPILLNGVSLNNIMMCDRGGEKNNNATRHNKC